mmetsp:Transcript_79643/g.221610  ORF Transcript_79643/g.221610 Transcript_79643/m.221610 type:complete len:508 (+) Transcript_79643:56-1579(+)
MGLQAACPICCTVLHSDASQAKGSKISSDAPMDVRQVAPSPDGELAPGLTTPQGPKAYFVKNDRIGRRRSSGVVPTPQQFKLQHFEPKQAAVTLPTEDVRIADPFEASEDCMEVETNGQDNAGFIPDPPSPTAIAKKIRKSDALWTPPDNQDANDTDVIDGSSASNLFPKVSRSPKRLVTHSGVLVRTITREGWRPLHHAPFATRPLNFRNLDAWVAANAGRLVGFQSQKGGIPGQPSQDELAIFHQNGFQIYFVVDGHGPRGEAVAQFSRRWLCDAVLKLVRQQHGNVLASGELTSLFSELQAAIQKEESRGAQSQNSDMRQSGCSAVVAVITPLRCLRVAWLGGCRCLAGSRQEAQKVRLLTPPTVSVSPAKLSRTFGLRGRSDLGRVAEEFVEANVDVAGLDFVILGSSGLWKGLTNEDATEIVASIGLNHAQHACYSLVEQSQHNQFVIGESTVVGAQVVQDATAVVAWLSMSAKTKSVEGGDVGVQSSDSPAQVAESMLDQP